MVEKTGLSSIHDRKHGAQKPARSKFRSTLAVLIMLFALFFFWVAFQPSSKLATHDQSLESKRISAVSGVTEKIVNQHLQNTNKKIEWEKKKAELQNAVVSPHIGDSVFKSERKNLQVDRVTGVDINSDRSLDAVSQDLDRQREQISGNSPSSDITSELALADEVAREEENLKQEYTEEFIKTARKNGFEVRVDKNYRIIDVKRINPPAERQSLFDASSTTGH